MYETKTVAVLRYVWRKNSQPKLMAAIPKIKADSEVHYVHLSLSISISLFLSLSLSLLSLPLSPISSLLAHTLTCIHAILQCLYMLQLPYTEDIRQYVFGSLPVKGAEPSGTLRSYIPSIHMHGHHGFFSPIIGNYIVPW